MNLCVCVKQVPGSNKVEIDPVTGVMKRDSSNSKLNPYDLYALELALQLADAYDGQVWTITMGPEHAKSVIAETLYMGADKGTVISDRRFAGADVLATSYTLAQGIQKADEYDVIICGKQTTDGDTAQVGPELAEHLGIPHVTCVLEILNYDKQKLTVRAARDGLVVDQTLQTPCLICVEDAVNTPRLPSYKRKKITDLSAIHMLSLDDLKDKNEQHYGLEGSPTQVVSMFPPKKREEKQIWEGTGEQLSDQMFTLLHELKMLKKGD